jgi:ribonuclease BN (tRNA processing enzyme)
VAVDGAFYVVDAGDGATRRIAKAGINVRDIGTIFLTHLHDDHMAGLGTLMSVAWNNQRIQPINVYGPPRIPSAPSVGACGQSSDLVLPVPRSGQLRCNLMPDDAFKLHLGFHT